MNRSPEESFEVSKSRRSSTTKINLQQATPSPQDNSSSIDSRGSNGESLLKVLPLKTSLTPSSQDGSSNPEEGQESSPKWIDSESSSEEECTTSYLTLCNEYGQQKVDPGSLNEEPILKADNVPVTKEQTRTEAHDAVAAGDLGPSCVSQEVKHFADDAVPEIASPTRILDSLNKSKNSPMEFFRIDSKDSNSELLGLDFGDKLYSLKSESLKPFFSMSDQDTNLDAIENKLGHTSQDTISRGSTDSVPVISFKDIVFDDVNSEEGRPDLLVNLPSITEPTKEATVDEPAKLIKLNGDILESKLLEAPDVLQSNNSTEQCRVLEQKADHLVPEESGGQCMPDSAPAGPGNGALFEGLGLASSLLDALGRDENVLVSNVQAGAKGRSFDSDNEAVLLFSDHAEDLSKEGVAPLCLHKAESNESGVRGRGENEIHQLFQNLDERLALTSRFYLPEGCVQRWAAEMVVALDALHREGIVCRDLNPNNVLLNDRGQELLQMHFFLFAVASN